MFDRRRILRLAEQYRARGGLVEAIAEYRKLVELDPGELFALHSIAGLELRGGDPSAAARTFAIIGERLVAKGWKLSAIYRYRRLIELSETLPEPERARHRSVAEKVDRLRTELAAQRAILALYDEAALALEQNGRDGDVVELLGKMILLEPDNPVFHARLAETYCRMGLIDDALPAFRRAASALIELERMSDALRVLERILHFRTELDDSLLAADLYLERAQPQDSIRAVAKLQPCIKADPESLDALTLLARAFDTMGQPPRATQVRIEIARVAAEAGEAELVQDLIGPLVLAAPDDSVVRALFGPGQLHGASAPSISVRGTFISVTDADLVEMEGALAESLSQSNGSVLDGLSFEELSEVWVTPVVSTAARRAMSDAEAFVALRLYSKAEYVLRAAVEQDPLCAELREALRSALKAVGNNEGFTAETIPLAELYRQRGFYDRAATLVEEVLAVDPASKRARRLATKLKRPKGERVRGVPPE